MNIIFIIFFSIIIFLIIYPLYFKYQFAKTAFYFLYDNNFSNKTRTNIFCKISTFLSIIVILVFLYLPYQFNNFSGSSNSTSLYNNKDVGKTAGFILFMICFVLVWYGSEKMCKGY
jgi:hypothetical protein